MSNPKAVFDTTMGSFTQSCTKMKCPSRQVTLLNLLKMDFIMVCIFIASLQTLCASSVAQIQRSRESLRWYGRAWLQY